MAVTEEHRWPCAQCGADLRFAPGQTELKCDHCGHVQVIKAAAPRSKQRALGELDLARGLDDDLPDAASVDVRSTSCPNCGAVVEFQGANHATECPFCATPVAIDTGSHRKIKPQALVPFALNENQARDALTKWLGGLWFAPNGLLEYTRKGRALNGIYVPYWTFDADTYSQYSGAKGVHYYETRTVTVNVNGRSEQRTEQVQPHTAEQHLAVHKTGHQIKQLAGAAAREPACERVAQRPAVQARVRVPALQTRLPGIPKSGGGGVGLHSGQIQGLGHGDSFA